MSRDRFLCWKTISCSSRMTFLESSLYLLPKYILFFILTDRVLYILYVFWSDALLNQVVILSLESVPRSNRTKVVFGLDPDADDSEIPSMSVSLIRSILATLVTNQSSLRITKSLFGEAFSFEVLKFPGGITIIPPQSAFLLQKVQILFNFTLNFSIHQIQVHFSELTSQLEAGLRLAPYEVLCFSLSYSFSFCAFIWSYELRSIQ